MDNLHSQIPSPKALLAFEATARHGSFTKASRELHVTQVAVSYQIRQLEEALGVMVFERQPGGIALTWAGSTLHHAVSHGLRHIAEAVHQIRKYQSDGAITIAANNAVSFYWLRPRLSAFQRAHPDVDLRMLTSDRDDLALASNGIDIAIRYGGGTWADYDARFLFEEVAFPVCAPGYARTHGPFRNPEDLIDENLLQLEPLSPQWVTWRKWFQYHGLDLSEKRMSVALELNSYPLLLDAAVEGQGVALGGQYIVDSLLDDHKLIRVTESDYRTGAAYYLITPSGAGLSENTELLRHWLMQSD